MASKLSGWIIFTAVLASLLEIIDTTIVNVAIPTMMGNLGATLEDISMVVTGYAVANAIVLPVAAWMAERLGRRKYFLGCIALFVIMSLACGLAPNLETLIVFRILQGLAGGALLPTAQTLIYEQFPKEKAGIAGAIFGMSVLVGPTLGPLMGGVLTDNFGWRSIFTINLPVGLLALFVGLLVIHDTAEQKALQKAQADGAKHKIDGWGLFLLALGVGCLQFTLERGEAKDWFNSQTIIATAIIAAIALPLFVWWELRQKSPIVNLHLFKDPIVQNGTMLMTGLGFFLYSIVFILPVFVSSVFHYTATQTGWLFVPGSLMTMLVMPFVGRALGHMDPRPLISAGLLGLLGALIMMASFSSMTSDWNIYQMLMVRGIAFGFLFVPINSSILSQFHGSELSQVSGLLSLLRQIGGSIGVAVVGTLLTTNQHQIYLELTRHVSMLNQPTQVAYAQGMNSLGRAMTKGLGDGSAHEAVLRSIAGRMQLQAFIITFDQMMVIIAVVMLVMFIPLWRLKLRTKMSNGPVDAGH